MRPASIRCAIAYSSPPRGREFFPAAEIRLFHPREDPLQAACRGPAVSAFTRASPRKRGICGVFARRRSSTDEVRALLAQRQSTPLITERSEVRGLHGASKAPRPRGTNQVVARVVVSPDALVAQSDQSAGLRNRRLKVRTLPGAFACGVVVFNGVTIEQAHL